MIRSVSHKGLREFLQEQDLDIQFEKSRSSVPDHKMKESDRSKIRKNEQNLAFANDERFLTKPDPPSDEAPSGEGSVGYRIAAMVAMFLLALAGFLFWYFTRK
jgi:hypothetical protein